MREGPTIRVLIVSAWDPRSGVLTIYRALAKHLGPLGVRFSAFAFDGWSSDTLWTFCDELIDGRETTLAEVLMSGRYDLLQCVHSAYSPPWGIETWVRRARFRGPVVLLGAGGERALTGPTHATRYIAESEWGARVLAEDASRPIEIIPSGYDESVFRPGSAPPTDRPLLVWVGRSFDPVKDVGLFLDLVERSPDVDAVLVDGRFEPSSDVRSRLDGFGGRVRRVAFLEPERMAELYRLAAASGGAVVNTSRSEGFNLSLVEALACGCPVVIPRIPGLAHLEDGVTAVTYDRVDGALGAGAALARLSDHDFRARIVEEGRRQAESRWTGQAMADGYLEVYEDALAEVAAAPFPRRFVDAMARGGWRTALWLRPRWLRLLRASRRLAGRRPANVGSIRILIVSAWDPRSGVLTIYRALAKHLGPLGVRFSAFAFDGWSSDTLWTFCDELIDGRETTLAEVLMSGRYDVLQCVESAYSPPWGIETWVRRARFRGPIVLLGAGGERVLTGPTHATRYIAVSETAAAVLAQDAARPVAAIVSGYDEEVFHPGSAEAEGRPRLVWVGRSFDPVKDVDLFLDLVELCPEYSATLVDSVLEPEQEVRERLDRIGERISHVSFLEPEQMAGLYRRAGASGGAIVNTSRSEGFNCSIVEAMACECPAVVPRIPGLVHLEDGATAVKYDRNGRAEAAAAALRRLDDPAFRAGLISEGRRQAASRWTAGGMAEEYLELYREALEATAASRSAGWVIDPVVRVAWRPALRLRPHWLRLRAR